MKKSQKLNQNRTKKILQYFNRYFIYTYIYTNTSKQKLVVFLTQVLQNSVKYYVIENTYFSCNIGQSA